MNAPHVVLAGGSGFLGRALARELVRTGQRVTILTRSPRASANAQEVFWDGRTVGTWSTALEGASALVNLAGKSVNCRFTPENMREIKESRTASVEVLAKAVERCAQPPPVWVQCGSLAIYGDAGESWCDEISPSGRGFSVETCRLWEGAFNALELPATRRVLFRIGFVLGRGGGALELLARLVRWGLGGTIGRGTQFVSWLHLADFIRMFSWAMTRDEMSGVYNACAPHPVTNRVLMSELRRVLHRPWSPPAPEWVVKIGSRLLGTEASLALSGRRCQPRRMSEHGFEFQFPEIRPALEDLFAFTPPPRRRRAGAVSMQERS
ncbi:MAG TPA: TIGR01777 family oxidoreductase [Chthoniobacteraceae bacterium]|nr:TIGR01777 family oxidoreductase [Chthoniobacteraceae bacterium]